MTVLAAGTTTCFLCDRVIVARAEAAQLPYACPDDVGEVARHGRPWAHRACWITWPQRAAWSRSSLRLMTSQLRMLSARGVIAMPTPVGALITDTIAALMVTVPREMFDELARAFGALHATAVAFGHGSWILTPIGSTVRVMATHQGEIFEDVVIEDPAAWSQVLRASSASHKTR